MAEIINKKAEPTPPFKVGDNPKIKVKALRPVLLGHHVRIGEKNPGEPIRVEKGDIGFVDETEYAAHAHILEKLALWILLLSLLLLPKAVEAQSYSANSVAGAQATNTVITNAPGATQTGYIAGGAMLASAVTNATTNYNVVTSPVGVTRYDSVSVMYSANTFAGANPATNFLFVYPCDDGVNVDTNHPLAMLPVFNTAGTNLVGITNLNSLILGATGYISFGLGSPAAGVVTTNPCIQVFVKPQKNG